MDFVVDQMFGEVDWHWQNHKTQVMLSCDWFLMENHNFLNAL